MGRHMGRNRWVALEQTMSSPKGILFISHFSHPPIFLVPENSHNPEPIQEVGSAVTL